MTVTQNNTPSSRTIDYTYDGKSQLVSAENDSVKWAYTYDIRGNVTSKSKYSISVDGNNQKVYTLIDTDTFSYTNSAWQDELTSFNNQSITYDSAGNPTNYRGNTLTWTMGRQLASYGNICYTYNEEGIRTSKTANNVTTRYYLDGTDIIAQTDGTDTLFFRYDSNDEIIGLTYSGADYFYVKNHMGDITGIADANGNLVAEYEYDPWGAVISVTGSNATLANANPFRYRSYYYDSDTGMYYLQSRYYDPEICRFVNADDAHYILFIGYRTAYSLFTYCKNEPVASFDYTGTSSTIEQWATMAEYLGHYVFNLQTLANVKKGLIDNQYKKPYSELKYGASTVQYNGCGVIAIFNALLLRGENPSLPAIILSAELSNSGMMLYGYFGTNPTFAKSYLKHYGISVKTYATAKQADKNKKVGDIFIITYVNRSKGIYALSWHTVTAIVMENGQIRVYNDQYKYYSSIYDLTKEQSGWLVIKCYKLL